MRLYQIHEFGDSGKINGNEDRETMQTRLTIAFQCLIQSLFSHKVSSFLVRSFRTSVFGSCATRISMNRRDSNYMLLFYALNAVISTNGVNYYCEWQRLNQREKKL